MTTKIVFLVLCVINIVFTYKLKQVVIISRHNIRAPQMKADVAKATQKTWLEWKEPLGDLTEKGALLETYMGKYFSQWFEKKGLVHGCPENKAVIYANDRQRTKLTAKKFAETAFENCNITVQVEPDYFFPMVRDDSEFFRKKLAAQVEREIEDMELDDAFEKLNSILDIKNSPLCKEKMLCDLTKNKTEIVFTPNHQVNVKGPLFIGYAAVDAFLMAYYDGVPIKKIAWGKIKEIDFETLTKLSRGYFQVVFDGALCPLHCIPLLKRMSEIFENKTINYGLFFGHDSVQRPVMCDLGFKFKYLPGTWDDNPISSKIVFQKWFDEANGRYLLKINHVYPTWEQLREGSELSLEEPPQSIIMELADCATDNNGFCHWEDFTKILNRLIN